MVEVREYDLVILGGGPGGVAAATSAALRGMKVALVNAQALMGYGLEGAYKSKMMYEIAREFYSLRTRWHEVVQGARVNFHAIHKKNRDGADKLRQVHAESLREMGIDLIVGWGRFVDPHTIEVGDDLQLRTRYAIIATGTSPRTLKSFNVDGEYILTSDEIVDVKRQINSMLVLGAGVIGSEFATIFAALGSEVTLVDTQPRIFNHDDADMSAVLTRSMKELGVKIRASERAQSMVVKDGRVHTTLKDGSEVITDAALLAIGRAPNTKGIGLEAAGVKLNDWGYIPTTEAMRSNVEHIYAVGDVGLRATELDISLVHVAEAEGRAAVLHINGEMDALNTAHVPFIVFTLPMIAGAGINEAQARKQFGDGVRIGKFANVRNHRAHTRRELEGFVKLIVGPEGDDRVLGVRAVGDGVDGIIGEVSIMVQHQLPYTHLHDAIQAHPSISESLRGAALMISGDSPPYTEGEEFDLDRYDEPAMRFTQEASL